MPTINDVCVELHCTLEGGRSGVVEELIPRPPDSHDTRQFMPNLYDSQTRTCSVFVPVFPQSQFHFMYFVQPPATPDVFYVFKLFINRDEIVTFSCDESNKWMGKAMFGLFDTSKMELAAGGIGVQKRVFVFNGESRVIGDLSQDKDEDRLVELRAYRAATKLRVPTAAGEYDQQGVSSQINLPTNGRPTRSHPLRQYMFELLDPIDQPRATFRFYYRTWDEIHTMRLRMGVADENDGRILRSANDIISKDPRRGTVSINAESIQHPYAEFFVQKPVIVLREEHAQRHLPLRPSPSYYSPRGILKRNGNVSQTSPQLAGGRYEEKQLPWQPPTTESVKYPILGPPLQHPLPSRPAGPLPAAQPFQNSPSAMWNRPYYQNTPRYDRPLPPIPGYRPPPPPK